MNLRDYLYFERKTLRNFSQDIGITEDYLGQICAKKKKPSKSLAKLIESITQGKVTAKELLEEKDDKLK